MHRILKARGISHVDYLSLDVEGHEVEVLKGFKLNEIQVDVITTELHSGDDGVRWREMFKFMEDAGYVHYPVKEEDKTEAYPRLLPEDVVFVHRSVSFGNAEWNNSMIGDYIFRRQSRIWNPFNNMMEQRAAAVSCSD